MPHIVAPEAEELLDKEFPKPVIIVDGIFAVNGKTYGAGV